jgi:Butirosin biosynthesis protein H, N-terminal/Domain of unknown function (DUF4872)
VLSASNVIIFKGKHCETTATGTLLNQLGIQLSEPMLFGLGAGLGFIYWNSKQMEFPFLGGRVKPDKLTKTLCEKLGLDYRPSETSSAKKAWDTVRAQLDSGKLVGLKLDSFYLEYFSKPIHFAGHYVAIYGYDDEFAYLVDTQQQGGFVRTSLKNLAAARNAGGPMASKNLSYVIELSSTPISLKNAVLSSIRENSMDFLNPPILNAGYKGIKKAAVELKKWFQKTPTIEKDFCTLSMIMEKAGTGGALFRNLYRDFLFESYTLTGLEGLQSEGLAYRKIAKKWTRVSALFEQAGMTKDIKFINEACQILEELSEYERNSMLRLSELPMEINNSRKARR